MAALRGHLEIVKWLVGIGANPNARERKRELDCVCCTVARVFVIFSAHAMHDFDALQMVAHRCTKQQRRGMLMCVGILFHKLARVLTIGTRVSQGVSCLCRMMIYRDDPLDSCQLLKQTKNALCRWRHCPYISIAPGAHRCCRCAHSAWSRCEYSGQL